MKKVNIKLSCRRDYMSVFLLDDKQYKALRNKIKKNGSVNVDEACEKLGRAEPLNRDKAIEYGLLVAENDPHIIVDVDGSVVFDGNVQMKAPTSNPYEYKFFNVDQSVADAFISEMKGDEFEADPRDDYSISNYLTNNFERVKLESAGYSEVEDGQKVLVLYCGGYDESATVTFNFELNDDDVFDIEKIKFFKACIEDQCDGISISGVADGYDIFLEDMIVYGNSVIGMDDVCVDDYGSDETLLGEYYPGDCISFE